MKRFKSIVIIGLTVLTTAYSSIAGAAVLKDSGVEVSGSFDVYSKYVWRGFTLDKDPVVQPGLNISYSGFTLSYWGSYDADNKDALNSDEMDYIIDYTKAFEGFSISLGNTFYTFPEASLRTEEFYIGASFDTFLSPSITIYYDYGDEADGGADGYYVSISASHSFAVSEDISFDLSGAYGYNNELFIKGTGYDLLLSAGFGIALTDSLSLSPSISYALPFGDLEDENDGNQDSVFYGGVSLSCSF